MFTICKTAKGYMGFVLERAEKEPQEQLTCAAVDFHRMEHKEETYIPLKDSSQKEQTECMTFQGTITGWCNSRMSSE